MRITLAIAAAIAATSAHAPWMRLQHFTSSDSYCIPNPRNDRAAKRRNKVKRG